jgi:hypothetical protein
MGRVLVNVMQSHWPVHFIAPDGKTRIGPWLLLDSHEEVLATLRWAACLRRNWRSMRVL